MIRLTRERSVHAVPAALRGDGRREKELQILLHRRAGGTFDREYWTPKHWQSCRDQLKRETAGKCAYCESAISASQSGEP